MQTRTKRSIVIIVVAFALSLLISGLIRSTQIYGKKLPIETELLADSIRSNIALASLQSWAVAEIEKLKSEPQRSGKGSHFFWTNNAYQLPVSETPDFIRKVWSRTNQYGEIWPAISVVLSEDTQPVFLVIDWMDHGVVLGPTDLQFPFEADGTNTVRPGVYTYYQIKQ